MKRVAAFAALALTSVALTSCGDDDYEPPITTTYQPPNPGAGLDGNILWPRVDSYCDEGASGIRVYVSAGSDGEMAVIADPSCL